MRLEDMKNDIPETPDFIHNMIQNEVAKQLADNKVANLRRRKRWTAPKVAAVAAACALAVSTAVYAGVNLYHWFLEKQGSYGVSVKIDAGDAVKKIALPDEVPEVDLSAKYIPEGMSWIDEYHLQYPEHDMTGGFSFSFVLLDKNDLGQVVQDQNVIDSEERTFGKYQGIYLKYNSITESGALNQRIYLVCPDLYRVLMIYIGDDVSKDEAIKVAENLVIEGNTTMVKTAGLPTWSGEMISEKTEDDNDEISTSVNEKKLPIYQIGDTFDLDVIGENTNGEYLEKTISAKVDSVQISDDLQLLDPDKIPQKWTEAIDADGKLSTNTLNYVKSGDGIDSLDEIVKSGIVPLLAACSVVASAKAAAPAELNFSWTTQPSVSLYAALAEVTSSPLRISSPSAVEPLRNTILAVVPISSIAVCGLKSASPVFHLRYLSWMGCL